MEECVTTFAVQWVFNTDPEVRLANLDAHRAYIRGLAAEGKVWLGGPVDEAKGALVIYSVAGRAELDELLAADPYTTGGVITQTTIQEWNAVAGSLLPYISGNA
ncbi:hypothetical protein D5S17_17930 [Pseudonocardiaceae bacterium YIM PH 21723]|nr:hypothetical protein D5S17_17930 [Pseudonocardiaceae bacterium YIM PH 21723]